MLGELGVGNTQMPAHQDQPNAQKLKFSAHLLKNQGMGSTWNHLVSWAAKTE